MRQATIYLATDGKRPASADIRTIARILQSNGIDGAFIAPGYGIDSGNLETSYSVTTSAIGMEAHQFVGRIRRVALRLRDVFRQDCVLVTWAETDADCTHDY